MGKQPDSRTRRTSKVHPVPINKMRTPPALLTQRPFRKAHSDYLAANLDLDKLGFPIVNHRDGNFWVLDGQHRIHALRERGFGNDVLDCEVYENLSDAEMADILLERDGVTVPRERLGETLLKMYERNAALAVKVRGRDHWRGIYYALCEWVGDLDEKNMPVERRSLALTVEGLVRDFREGLLGNIPADVRARLEAMVAEDFGRKEIDR